MSGKTELDNNPDNIDEFHDAVNAPNEKSIEDLINTQLNIEEDSAIDNSGDEHEAEVFNDCEEEIIDEEALKEMEKDMTEEEKLNNRVRSNQLKEEGNEYYKNNDYLKSIEKYTKALSIAPSCYPEDRSILYANRAAAKIKLDSKSSAIDDCTKAISLNEAYTKVYLRRATLYEETDKLDESLLDFKKVLEVEPTCKEAQQALLRLPPLIEERNEKLKTEMMGKLKDLGNVILKPFGLSTNNFQLQQDPSSGSYSINFKQ